MKTLTAVFTLLLMSFSVGCTRYVVLFSPPATVDPLPLRVSELAPQENGVEKVPWNIEAVGLDQKAADNPLLQGNLNVKVALLSTGIDYNHEDLVGQVAVNWLEVTKNNAISPSVNYKDDDDDGLVDNVVGWDVVDGDGLAYDRHGAGTAVAGIIAASVNGYGVRGIVDKVSLYPIRYINDHGQTDVPKLADALVAAVKVKPDVVFIQTVYMPLGGEMEDSEVAALETLLVDRQLGELEKLNIPVVVGAGDGNTDFESTTLYNILAKRRNVIAVTSVNKDGGLALLANRGQKDVALAAPGDKVFTTLPNNRYGEFRGTAFAAAHLVGALALAKAQYGDKLSLEQHVLPAVIDPKSLKPLPAVEWAVRSGSVLDVPKLVQSIGERVGE